MVKLLLAGDLYPMGRNQPLFEAGNVSPILGGVEAEVADSDLFFANLEAPLLDRQTPAHKDGPNLHATTECAKGLKAIGLNVVGLANNHAMDHGVVGLQSTFKALAAVGIEVVGAGDHVDLAARVWTRVVNDCQVGVLALAENEFGCASEKEAGVAPLDPILAVEKVLESAAALDALVVVIHGGNENFPFPRPGLQRLCRAIVRIGASAVICQHSHCLGAVETYRGKPIVYGQGNFIFDWGKPDLTWRTGALVQLKIAKDSPVEMEMKFFRSNESGIGIDLLEGKEQEICIQGISRRSKLLADPEALDREWLQFCRRREAFYLSGISGRRSILRRIAGKIGLLRRLEGRDTHLLRMNLVRCDSHREALLRLFEDISEDLR